MKNKIKILITIITLTFNFNLIAQIGGNQIYRNDNNNYNRSYNRAPVETTSVYSTDSTLTITSKVLLNQKAKHYLITIGVKQIGKTVLESNNKINARIENVKKKLKKIKVLEDDVYVDFISETKLYDFKLNGNQAIEYFDGISIRKNIIIKVNELSKIEKIITYCSEDEIYDIIKVDYVNEDLEKVNAKLQAAATKVIQSKKKTFESRSSMKISKDYRLSYEKTKIFYPKNLYKQYSEAFETGVVTYFYNNNKTKKEIRKEKTYYYDGIDTEHGVDKIIDEISPVVGIQYILELQVVYKLNK